MVCLYMLIINSFFIEIFFLTSSLPDLYLKRPRLELRAVLFLCLHVRHVQPYCHRTSYPKLKNFKVLFHLFIIFSTSYSNGLFLVHLCLSLRPLPHRLNVSHPNLSETKSLKTRFWTSTTPSLRTPIGVS